jgi:hypothetical protein
MADKTYLERVTEELTDKGKLIEAGWMAFRIYMIPTYATKDQIIDMRMAFFSGAQHLYGSIMTVLEPGDEPTEKDMDRMRLIHDEMEVFRLALEAKMPKMPTKGSA